MTAQDPSLLRRLTDYGAGQTLPLHMPGHKRNCAAFPHLAPLGGGLDITEVAGFDNLHDARGILRDSMARAAALWGSGEAFWLVNGSTGGLLAALRTLTHRAETVLLARNAHQSVFHALELCGLRPVFLLPPVAEDFGVFGSLTPAQVAEGLERCPDAAAVVLTSPTYEGVISDIAGICREAHRRNVPVLVDEAHGAHLGLHGVFPAGAVSAGADLVVQSLHKTLPSLTQTALLHVQGQRVDRTRLTHQLAVFQTSSPSYLLLAAMDGCVRALEAAAPLADWRQRLRDWDARLGSLAHLRLLHREAAHLPCVFAHDPGKLLISTRGTTLTGPALAERLRRDWQIEPEMASPQTLLAMTGPGDTEETFSRLTDALVALDAAARPAEAGPAADLSLLCADEPVLPAGEALEAERLFLPPAQAAGRIAGEYVWAYPPGIPLLLPGERIGAAFAQLAPGRLAGLHSTCGRLPEEIAVLR